MKLIRFVIILLFSSSVWAQQKVCFLYEPKPAFIKNQLQCFFTDSVNNYDFLVKREISALQQKGFMMPIIKEKVFKDSMFIELNPAKQFKNFFLLSDNETNQAITDAGIRLNRSNFFSVQTLDNISQKLLANLQNSGYPFAAIVYDSANLKNDTVFVNLRINKGNYFVFDSLSYAGTAIIKNRFLQKYLSIKIGSYYNEALISSSVQKLSALPYIQVYAEPAVYFYGNKAKPYFYLNNKNANLFNATIGFAPNSNINNKLVLTGEANLKLQNISGSGKSFGFNYRNFLAGSQDIDLNFNWPYFLNTNIGTDYSFKLLRFDSLFTDLTNQIGFQYLFSANNNIKLFYEQQNVFTINADTNYVKINRKLPQYNDVVNRLYGIAVKLNGLNYTPNPSKGLFIQSQAAIGSRQIIKNNEINSIKLNSENNQTYSIYDSVNLQSLQYRFNGNLSFYNKIISDFVWHNQIMFGSVYAPNLFINDLYRIGGLRTLRGFDEQSIFANNYAIVNTELRYLFSLNSNLIIFYNYATYQNILASAKYGNAQGFGIGLNLQSGNGVFSFYYAVGKQNQNPYNFNSAKIHFGYINYF
ncbi:MAG: hypothetical protein ACK4K9_05925 [Bacteroidia bacterium]